MFVLETEIQKCLISFIAYFWLASLEHESIPNFSLDKKLSCTNNGKEKPQWEKSDKIILHHQRKKKNSAGF